MKDPMVRFSVAIGGELLQKFDQYRELHRHPNRHAFPAMIAIRAIGKGAAPPEAKPDQLAVDPAVNQVAGRRDLRSRKPVRQVAAGVRSGRVELERGQRQVVEFGHLQSLSSSAATFQALGVRGEFTNRESSAANTCRETGRAPNRDRWAVSCWQSISGTSRRFRSETRLISATLDESGSRANIDSPKNMRPNDTP